MEPVRLGIIGCGVIGSAHLQSTTQSQLVEVVAVADTVPQRREYAQQQGVARVYDDGRAMLDEDPDVEAVILAFPVAGRTAMGLYALECGKHILLEKPVAMNADEVRQMIAAQGELVAGCCSSRLRHLDSARAATDFIATGALGKLQTLWVRAILPAGAPTGEKPPPWRQSHELNAGGILVNWGCYDMDYLLGITGWAFQPTTVLAQTRPVLPEFVHFVAPGSDADSYYTALVLGEEGTVLSMERGEFMAAAGDEAWQIMGTKGSLTLPLLPAEGNQLIHDKGTKQQGVISEVIWEGDESHSIIGTRLIEDFATAIRQGRSPLTSLKQSLVIAQITDAIYESAAQGEAVQIT